MERTAQREIARKYFVADERSREGCYSGRVYGQLLLDYNFKSAAPSKLPTNEITALSCLRFREPLSHEIVDEHYDTRGLVLPAAQSVFKLAL